MSSLIACPGCNHKLTLPDDFAGERVKCPMCGLEFDAMARAIPPMEVDAPTPPRPETPPEPRLETAYAPRERAASASGPSDVPPIYCMRCGAEFAGNLDACPECGNPVYERDDSRHRRRPAWRNIEPVRDFLPVAAAIMVPLGILIFFAGPVITDGFRPRPPGLYLVGILLSVFGAFVELVALCFALTWLYQAWRAVLHGDAEYSPGLMVGMLFVPFFNLYCIFRAVPGLSLVIHQEMKRVAPHRNNAAGWTPGLAGSIIFLIPFPPVWIVAVCMLLAWMLLANNAIQRLIRIHQELREWSQRDSADMQKR